jgi:ubiquitin carboxyl-terminal hydrolase 4/11/15
LVFCHRFRNLDGDKLETYLDFPFRLDIAPVPGHQYVSYDLCSISNHYGTVTSGHYTAYCKNAKCGKWYEFIDDKVSEMSNNSVRSEGAYIQI